MKVLKLKVFDMAHAVTSEQEAAIMKSANGLLYPQTLDEFIEDVNVYDHKMIGTGLSGALNELCQAACEINGIHAASKTFIIEGN